MILTFVLSSLLATQSPHNHLFFFLQFLIFNFAAFFSFYPAHRPGPHFDFGINYSILSPSRRQMCSLADSIFWDAMIWDMPFLFWSRDSESQLLKLRSCCCCCSRWPPSSFSVWKERQKGRSVRESVGVHGSLENVLRSRGSGPQMKIRDQVRYPCLGTRWLSKLSCCGPGLQWYS